jgi:tetratricopeptide (TPR) repeat protein
MVKATVAEAQNKAEDRQQALERALEIKPSDEPATLQLAELLTKLDLHQDALRRLKECQKAGCASAGFYRALVQAYRNGGQIEDAKSQLNEALRAHPNDTGLLMLQAADEVKGDRLKTAKAIYAQIIENDRGYAEAYTELAALELAEGPKRRGGRGAAPGRRGGGPEAAAAREAGRRADDRGRDAEGQGDDGRDPEARPQQHRGEAPVRAVAQGARIR